MKHSDTFKEARRLYKLGLAIHWLHPKSKRPIESGWTTGPRKSWDYLAETYIDGLNVGVRLGSPSKMGRGFLAVVDVDVKSTDPKHKREAHEAAQALIDRTKCPIVCSGRGNGSRHYYCVTAEPFKTWNPAASEEKVKVSMPSKSPSKKELAELTEKEIARGIRIANAWEISLYSDGRQVVLPPSIHPDSGKPYSWSSGLEALRDLPLLEFEKPEGEKESSNSGGKRSDTDYRAVVLEDFEISPVEVRWLEISERILNGILTGDGVTDRSGFLLPVTTALHGAGCSKNEILTILTEPDTFLGACAYDHAKTKDRRRAAYWLWKYTVKRVLTERSGENVFSKIEPLPIVELTGSDLDAQNEEFGSMKNWQQDLKRGEKGAVLQSLKNVDLILSNTVEKPAFVKDLFANRDAYGVNAPWGGVKGTYLTDIDLSLAKRWLADSSFQFEPNTALVHEATTLIAHRHRVHPVRQWLSNLKWDGVERIDTWIKDLLRGEGEEPYLSEVSRVFLLAMVKRVFEPGCQWDYVLVLEGDQGNFKSSTARALASSPWFMDNLPDLRDKDAMLNLQGKWLVELGELASVKRADHNLVKDYLIRRSDTVRSPFHRLKEDIKRQSVFIGTVNEGQYLKDPTGNRRFWPVKVGLCDVKELTRIREQLFAEAYSSYKTFNEDLKLSPEAAIQAKAAQESRRVDDDETEMREALLQFMEENKAAEADERFDFSRFHSRELFSGVRAPWGKWADKSYSLQTAAQVLRNLGFLRVMVRGQRIWKPGEETVRLLRGAEGSRPPSENGSKREFSKIEKDDFY